MSDSPEETLFQRLNQQTAKIVWTDLQPFFARGQAVWVSPALDLIDVAVAFAEDNSVQVQAWMGSQHIELVTEQRSADWLVMNCQVWAVVVAPWVLVQDIKQ